jgi:hypothetical protein
MTLGRYQTLPSRWHLALFIATPLLVATLLVGLPSVFAATLRLPQNYPTIQAAIDAARPARCNESREHVHRADSNS